MQRFLILFLSCFLLVVTFTTDAQRSKAKPKSRSTLEREKRENLRRIKEANRILAQTKAKKEASIGQLNALKEKINVQKGVIRTVSSELNFIEKDVRKTENLNQELDVLTVKKQEKERILNNQIAENKNLLNMKGQQDQVISKLSKKEQELRREVERRQQSVRKLDNLIADMVREEIARAARAARAKNAAKSGTAGSKATEVKTNKVSMTPEMAVLSSSFSGNRGRLLWPVGKGFISQRFGKHAHPVLKGVVIENRGVDLQTSQGEVARSVFDGKVLTVASVPGMNNIVMIQHGDYFTVFAKLKTVSVSEGQTVKRKDIIGTIYTNAEGTTELQFQIWKNSTNLNPESWLAPK